MHMINGPICDYAETTQLLNMMREPVHKNIMEGADFKDG